MLVRSAAVVAASVMMLTATACSNDSTKPVVAEAPTTTDPTLAADLEPTPEPEPAATIVQGLETAVASADFCEVLAAVDAAEPDSDDPTGAIDVYRSLAATAAASRPFLPDELRVAWEAIVVGTEAAAQAIEDHDGDVHDPEVEAALTSTAMVEALESVERYQLTTCPAPSPVVPA